MSENLTAPATPAQNHLLAALPAADYERLQPDLERVPLPRWWTGCWPRTVSTRWNSACGVRTAHSNGFYGTGGSIRSTRQSSSRGMTSRSKRAGRSPRYNDPMKDRKELTPQFEPAKAVA